MRHVVREIMPNDMPMILQGELSEKGNVLVDSVRVIPLTPCTACPNDEQNKKLAIRLHLLLRQ